MTHPTNIPIEWFDLASEAVGGAVLFRTDDFFAEADNLLRVAEPIWREDAFTDRGKWMDGWESRRRRAPGHDWCHIRLGVPGRVRRIIANTTYFRGNYPESCSIEGCVAPADATTEFLEEEAAWREIVPRTGLEGHSENTFEVDDRRRFTHLRFHIYPDGGVARLRVYGEPIPDPAELDRQGRVDLASMLTGASTLAQSDMFFGRAQNLLKPTRGVNMGDGWETRRRRGPGHDWVVIRLAGEGLIEEVEVDTTHFKGNYPDRFTLEGMVERPVNPPAPAPVVVGETRLMAHTRHRFDVEDPRPAKYAILRIYPDGGVSRLRLYGRFTPWGRRSIGLRWLNALDDTHATTAFRTCCGSRRWAETMTRHLPFDSLEEMTAVSDSVWGDLSERDYLEAFRAHPRIGERQTSGWSASEQASMSDAEDAIRERLRRLNDAYYEKHGFIFIICATGRSPEEMLAALETRLEHDTAREVAIAASEQAQITKLRLARLINGGADGPPPSDGE